MAMKMFLLPRSGPLVVAATVLLLAAKASAAASSSSVGDEKQCSIFMARSSLKGHTGFGLYTTRGLSRGDAVLSGPPGTPDGPTVAVVDSTQNVPLNLRAIMNQWHNVWGNYWWGRGVPDTVGFESDTGDVVDYQILFGSLPNHQCALQSIDMVWPESPYEDSLLSRYEDPGAGSFSYHRGRIFQATRDVPAGSELFLSYGYCDVIQPWAEGSEYLHYPDWARDLPMTDHYRTATRAIRELWDSLVKEFGSVDKIPNSLEFDPAMDMEPQVAQLIPRDALQLKRIMNHPVAKQFRHPSELFHVALAEEMLTEKKTVEWIRENGLCVEHLIPAPSTLRQAGQGGFAQHKIKKGELIVPAPLLQIADREVMTMLDEDGNVKGTQLLLNYCFGHKDTSLLVCPDTNAYLVNHCSDRTKECGPDGPNAKFQWGLSWDPDTPAWLNMTVDDILKQNGRGLSIEIVALRDIQPGEEVFMDYGVEWEEAWAEYTKSWKPPEDGREYSSVKKLNEDPNGLDQFVSGELRSEVEHPYLFTACVYYPSDADDDEVWEQSAELNLDELTNEELLERFADDGSGFAEEFLTHGDGTYWPCAVLYEDTNSEDEEESDKDLQTTYAVRIIQRDYTDHGDMTWATNSLPRFLVNYPKDSIHIFAKPYASDQHLPNTFRHYIPLPDDMLPDVWRNLKDGVRQSQKRVVRNVPPPFRSKPREEEEEDDDDVDDDDEEE